MGAWWVGISLPGLTQFQPVPPDITSVQLSITSCEQCRTCMCPTVHTITRERLTHEKIYLYVHFLLHKLEATLREKACSWGAGLETQPSPGELSPWALFGLARIR